MQKSRRKQQNREAQRAFRERKEMYIKELEFQVSELRTNQTIATAEREHLVSLVSRLQLENDKLRSELEGLKKGGLDGVNVGVATGMGSDPSILAGVSPNHPPLIPSFTVNPALNPSNLLAMNTDMINQGGISAAARVSASSVSGMNDGPLRTSDIPMTGSDLLQSIMVGDFFMGSYGLDEGDFGVGLYNSGGGLLDNLPASIVANGGLSDLHNMAMCMTDTMHQKESARNKSNVSEDTVHLKKETSSTTLSPTESLVFYPDDPFEIPICDDNLYQSLYHSMESFVTTRSATPFDPFSLFSNNPKRMRELVARLKISPSSPSPSSESPHLTPQELRTTQSSDSSPDHTSPLTSPISICRWPEGSKEDTPQIRSHTSHASKTLQARARWLRHLRGAPPYHPIVDLIPSVQMRDILIKGQETDMDMDLFSLDVLCSARCIGDPYVAKSWRVPPEFFRRYPKMRKFATQRYFEGGLEEPKVAEEMVVMELSKAMESLGE
ncbi:hypothetical protein HDV05_003846 [Chytridiales sp. JEL 0842]|nr:hypothetical protein HDV05_003846 [Chytridiales sp. JEL 0842]